MRRKRMTLAITCMFLIALLVPASLSASTLFHPFQTYRSGGRGAAGRRSIVVADVNGDGKPDLVVATQCISASSCNGAVGVLLGNGDGTFQAVKVTDSGLPFASSIAVGDLNGDGKPDLVVSTSAGCSPVPCTQLTAVMLGNGDGTFRGRQVYATGGLEVNAITLADVNGDGKLDLLVANQCLDTFNCEGVLGVLLGNGDGTFRPAQTYDSGGRALFSLAVSDVNGDGKLDVAVVNEGSGVGIIGVLLGNGDGTFQPVQTYDSGGDKAHSIAVADVNGDGKPDLIVTNEHVNDNSCASTAAGVLLNNGDGTFQIAKNYCAAIAVAQSVAVADVNGDGHPDLLIAYKCPNFCALSAVSVMLGNGDGTFKAPLKYSSGGWNSYSITAADVNGDSKPDLLVANACVSKSDCTTANVGVLLGSAGVKTTTKLVSSLNPSVYGQAVRLTATVTSVGTSTPTGTVRFQNGTTGLATVTLSGGLAVLTIASLPAGIRSLTAIYNGDPESAKSTSAPLSQTVKKASTTTAIASSLNPSTQGQLVTFTATVTSPTVHAIGTVTFTANGVTLGTVALSGGKARLSTSALPKGSNEKITGTYGGTVNITGSAASLLQTVN